jgi:hypothetical protein
MRFSVISAIPCELITFPSFEMDMLSPIVKKEYKAICKPYADDEELRRVYLDLIKWEKWKKTLIENIKVEKTNKK